MLNFLEAVHLLKYFEKTKHYAFVNSRWYPTVTTTRGVLVFMPGLLNLSNVFGFMFTYIVWGCIVRYHNNCDVCRYNVSYIKYKIN